MNDVKLTEHQFHVVWTEAVGRKSYDKNLFQEVLEALKHKGKVVSTKVEQEDKKIIDEMCYCGHKRSEHTNRFDTGHGRCSVPNCVCAQFTWEKFILEE